MPLGADHEQAARLQRFVLLSGDFGGDLGALLGDLLQCRLFTAFLGLGRDPIGDQHVGIAAELNVGAASRHVGGDGDRAWHARLRNDPGLLLVVAGVQHLMRHFLLLEQFRQDLGLLDGGGADQHRLTALPCFLD
jgi:hypothetical protein